MRTQVLRFQNKHSVQLYVNRTLCELENLELDHFPLSERVLHRGGEACAVMFILHGPRQLQVSAVWELASGTIWFYNSVGHRCKKSQLAANIVGT